MEKSGFFNSINKDRRYPAEEWANYLKAYFTNGIFNNGLAVLTNNDMTVTVREGHANIEGYRYTNTGNLVLKVEVADGILSRIDNVVIRLDLTNRLISTQVIKGSFSDNPVAPDLVRNSTIYDLRIAKISIPAGTTTITQDLIEDTRFLDSNCGNVISTVETPNTEELYAQLYAKAEKLINDSQEKFTIWFKDIQKVLDNVLDDNVAYNLSRQIEDISNISNYLQQDILKIQHGSLKSFETTLLAENWVLNETTNLYEYDVVREDITASTEVRAGMDLENQEKIGSCYADTYDGGFKIFVSGPPEENIDITFYYQLANISLGGTE